MNKLIKIIFVLGFLLPICAHGQAVTWSKWFDYNNYDNVGEDVVQTFDGGYLVLGSSYFPTNNSSILIKTDQYGSVEWQKIIDQTVTQGVRIILYAVHQSQDSGFILSGQSSSDSAVLIKTDKSGNIDWIRKYSRPGARTKFFNHKITLDGGIIACGQLFFSSFKAFVVKTDSIGNVEWDSSYSLVSGEILQSNDSNYYFISLHSISKINPRGKIIWTSGLGNIGSSMIQQNAEELYTLYTGNNLDSMLLNKIDSSGNLLWRRSYFPVTRGSSLCFSKDGNILIAGYKDTINQYDIVTAKVDLNGNMIYRKRINVFSGDLYMLPYSVKATTDYGFIFTGPTDFPGSPHQDNIFALKTDSLCNSALFTGININEINLPKDFQLFQNYPNPFNPSTTISYSIPKSGIVSIKIFDLTGKEIETLVNEVKPAGSYEVEFDGSNLSSGVYFYRIAIHSDKIESGSFIQSRRMVLLK